MTVVALAACGDGDGSAEPDAGTEPDANEDSSLTAVTCPSEALIAMNAQCGRFAVADESAIEIGYAVVPAATPSPGAKPLVFLIGGPGPSGVFFGGGSLQASGTSSFMRADRDVVLVDYRGVGLSEPAVGCPTPTSLPELAPCVAAVESSSIAFDDFRSAEFAKDTDALLAALEYDSVVLWGGSYGTRLALTMMRDVPGRISHVVLDGVFPPEVNGLTESATAPLAALGFVADRCAQSTECQQAFGDLRVQIAQIATTLSANELAPQLLEGIASLAGHRATPLLINTLAAMDEAGIVSALESLANVSYRDVTGDDNPGLTPGLEGRAVSVPMSFGVICSEETPFVADQPFDDEPFGLADVVDDLFADFQGGADFPPAQAPAICAELGVSSAASNEIARVESDIPTLVLSGIRDMQTSPVWGARAAASLSVSTHLVFPLTGHVVTSRDLCGQQVMAQFVGDPTAELDTTCVDAKFAAITISSDDVLAEFSTP